VRGRGEEVRAVLEGRRVLAREEPQVELVHERRRLERVVGALGPHLAPRELAQLVVQTVGQALDGARLPAPGFLEDASDVGHAPAGELSRR
jgi:hypothetical protein